MIKLTVDQIRMLYHLTGDDYGFNGKKLKKPRSIQSKYRNGIMTIREILDFEHILSSNSFEGYISHNDADRLFRQIHEATIQAMKDSGITPDDKLLGSVYQFKKNIRENNASTLISVSPLNTTCTTRS